MLLAYIAPVAFVYYKYNTAATATATATATRSISSIITSQEPFFSEVAPLFQTRYFIAVCMLIMTAFTVFYEYQRCVDYMNSRMWSLASISVLLLGIFGVIFIPEHNPVHYIFAAAAFFAIVGFMTGHTFTGTTAGADIHDILRILLYAQILFMIVTVIGVIQDAAIFTIEALFLANFAIFYLYLHYHTFCSSLSPLPSCSPLSS
jgi:membrane-associated HD superfamily phosphohydrolase